VILTLAGQAFHFLFEFVVTQGQAEVCCMADIIDKILIQFVSEQCLLKCIFGTPEGVIDSPFCIGREQQVHMIGHEHPGMSLYQQSAVFHVSFYFDPI